jgi:hypothetical protein
LGEPVGERGGGICPAGAHARPEDLAEGGVAEGVVELFGVGGVRREGEVDVCEAGEQGVGWGWVGGAGTGGGGGSRPLEAVVDVVSYDEGVVLAG